MTHRAELQGKCRYFFYAKVDLYRRGESSAEGDTPETTAGTVFDIGSGGGGSGPDHVTGADLISARFGGTYSPDQVGCVEEYYNPLPVMTPASVNLSRIQGCVDAVDAHHVATKAEADFVFEKGIKLFGSEVQTTPGLRHVLKVQEMHTRDDSGRVSDHDAIIQAQTDLEALCKTCDDCCEQLLVTRDAVVTFTPITYGDD
jgi:hypothetical protein